MKLQFLFLLIVCTGVSYCENDQHEDGNQSSYNITDAFTLVKPFSRAIEIANVTPVCKRHFKRYIEDLKSLQLWALKMYDSTGQWPSGVLNGNARQYGDFDECTSIETTLSDDPDDHILGKHCLVSVLAQPVNSNSTWDHIMELAHSYNYVRNTVYDNFRSIPLFSDITWSVCVPSSCTPDDLYEIATQIVLPYNYTTGLDIRVKKIIPDVCVIREDWNFTAETYLFCFITFIIVVFCIMGSFYEYMNDDVPSKNKPIQIICAFSLKSNYRLLTSIEKSNDTDITCVHGLRTIFSIIIYLLHRSSFGLLKPLSNRTEIAFNELSGPKTMFFRAFMNHVDSFVITSGLLTSFYAVNKLQQGKRLNIFMMYIKRYMKFAPLHHFMYLWGRSFSLPLGGQIINTCALFFTNCRTKPWYKVLLMIDNYDGLLSMCFPPAHQLYTDWQMYLLSPFIIMLLWKFSKHAWKIIGSLIVVFTMYTIYFNYFGNIPSMMCNGVWADDIVNKMEEGFTNPLHRLKIYLIGIALGYYLSIYGKNHILTHHQKILGWFIALACVVYAFFGYSECSEFNYEFDVVRSTIYACLQPLTFGVFFCWIVFVCHSGQAPTLNAFLSWNIFAIFSRIAYPFYFVQMPVIMWYFAPVPVYGVQKIDMNEFCMLLLISTGFTMLIVIPVLRLFSIFMNTGQVVDKGNEKYD